MRGTTNESSKHIIQTLSANPRPATQHTDQLTQFVFHPLINLFHNSPLFHEFRYTNFLASKIGQSFSESDQLRLVGGEERGDVRESLVGVETVREGCAGGGEEEVGSVEEVR